MSGPLPLSDPVGQLYAQLGEETLAAIVRGFYARVAEHPLLRPMYPEQDLAPAEERLLLFLRGRFGGPPDYVEQRGHPRLRMRHAPFPIDRAARDAWMACMDHALDGVELELQVQQTLRAFLDQVATFLINRR
ncbi:MAG: globin [Planctomycetes bacterium]|nr:globin [Planctomycetota bacterium]